MTRETQLHRYSLDTSKKKQQTRKEKHCEEQDGRVSVRHDGVVCKPDRLTL